MAASNQLAVFDFDHTLVDGNTDTWITKLYEDARHVQNNQDLCWTDIMAEVFRTLHEKKFTKLDFEHCLQSLPFTEGMKELLSFIATQNIQCAIISDSNSYFIKYLLEFGNVMHCVKEIYSNPANWTDSQLLTIQHYHTHNCGQCPINMCKGDILKSYIRNTDSEEKTILYIGDGRNDYCATLQMKPSDYVFAREGYRLLKLLKQNVQKTQPIVIPWTTGFDILSEVKSIVEEQE
jgi:pyridoxal phosphate phosphatase PHOSPHO2